MAEKIKKISVSKFEEAVNSSYEATHDIDYNGITITVKQDLTLKEMVEFISSVVMSCFDDETSEYTPEIKDFAVRSCIFEYYTNINLPSNVEKRYDIIYHTQILDSIMQNINQLQFNAMMRAIEDKTSHIANSNVEMINRQMAQLYDSFENIGNKLSSTFDGIGDEDIKNVVKAFSDGKIDEEKLVKAYMDTKVK